MNFKDRKRQNAKLPRVNNATLPAGSPMFYYCRLCGAEMTRPEDDVEPAPKFCPDCISEGRARDEWNLMPI